MSETYEVVVEEDSEGRVRLDLGRSGRYCTMTAEQAWVMGHALIASAMRANGGPVSLADAKAEIGGRDENT